MMRFFSETNFDFIGWRKLAFLVSLALIIIGLVSLIWHQGPRFGIDFRGGTLLEFHFEPPVLPQQIRGALREVNLGDRVVDLSQTDIQELGSPNDILIRVEEISGQIPTAEALKQRFKAVFPNHIPEEQGEWVRRQEIVGPKIGKELRLAAVYATILALIAMLIYIAWRFEFRFAVAAVVALFHDVLITLGMLSVFNWEVSLSVVAALLTIVGYSLNDTIVVFDRIRESLKLIRRESFEAVVNRSINDTLSRTVITGLTTLMVLLILFFQGGEVIHGFAFTMLIGIIVGTYSSVFVASPLLVEWQRRAEARKSAKRRRG